jgi:hypothetical protein
LDIKNANSEEMGNLKAFSRSVKIWVAVSLVSLLVYVAYVLRGSFAILVGYFVSVPDDVRYVSFTGGVFWLGLVGLIARFSAVMFGLAAVGQIWVRAKPFLQVKGIVAIALFLEGLNFLMLAPSVWFLLNPSTLVFSPSLGLGYVLQIVFTVPFLWLLAGKLVLYREISQKASLLRYAACAFLGYAVALTANELSRWASMISVDTLQFIFQGIRAVGFFNAVALMPFSVVFAAVGAYRLFQYNVTSAVRWIGASLFVVGLNYSIYVVFSFMANSLNTLPLVDVWTVPLLGLGITLLAFSRRKKMS